MSARPRKSCQFPGLLALAALLTGLACGAAAEEGSGDRDLPTRLAGPYGKLEPDPDTPLDEPAVLEDPDGALAYYGPSARLAADDTYTVYFTAEAADGEAHLRRAIGVDLASEPRDVSVVLEAAEAWEATRLAHPSVLTPGLSGAPVGLFYEAGAGGLGYAESSDGLVFQRTSGDPLLAPLGPEEGAWLGHPCGVWHDGRVLLYYTAGPPGSAFVAEVSAGAGGVLEVTRLDADPLVDGRTPVLGPNPLAELFDEGGIGGVSVWVSNEADRPVFDLWYGGRSADGDLSIGFAGSYDGLLFKRFEDNPVLPTGVPAEADPSVVPQSVSAVMFYTQGEGANRFIGAAVY